MKRPLPVTLIAALFIAVGVFGLAAHTSDRPLNPPTLVISLVHILAIAAGIFLLLGHNWARWLAVAWLAFHVVISASHSLQQFLIHLILLVLIAYLLFKSPASSYFRAPPST